MKLAAALRPALALVGLALSTCNRDQPLAPASPRGGTPRFEVAPSNSTMPTWIDLAPSGGPPDALGSLVADPASGRVIVFGGLSNTGSNTNATWVLVNGDGLSSPAQWTNLIPNGASGSPPGRHGQVAVYDGSSNRMIIFGGCMGGCLPVANDVWVLTNANGFGGTPVWIHLAPTGTAPLGRNQPAAVYDAASNRMIVFGGQNGGGAGGATYPEVWVLTNANGLGGTPSWTQLSPTGGPPPGQYGPTAVYDAVNNRMTVFGGAAQASGILTNAVWVLSHANGLGGTPAWTNIVANGAAGAPPARQNHMAGYDPAGNWMMIFGGCGGCTDTWVLTNPNGLGGSPTWSQLSPSGGPPLATGAGAFNVTSLRLTTVGNASTNAAAWVLRPAAAAPAAGIWTASASMATPRELLGVAAISGTLYAVGGNSLATVEAYDPGSNTWTTKASMATPREGLGVAAINGTLYAVGGRTFISSGLATVEAYDPGSNTWTTRASMPTRRAGLGVTAINGTLYAVGGDDGGGIDYFGTVAAYDPGSNTWTTKASMPTPRTGLGVAAINGTLYAVGGYNPYSGGFLATVEAYDPGHNTWSTRASMPTARRDLGVVAINGTLYAVGGRTPNGPSATVEAYDPGTDTWTARASLPTPRAGLGVAAINGTLYAVGGFNSATVEAYDLVSKTWTTKASMPTPRGQLGVGAISGTLYAVGGFKSATVEAYDPGSNTWTTKASMATPREGLGVAAINGTLYAVGGFNLGGLATVEAYDPGSNTWTTRASMPTRRAGLGVTAINGTLYAVGGDDGGGIDYFGTVAAYDPGSNTWTTKASMPTPRTGLGVAAINGTLYAVGGYNSGGSLATVEAYDPGHNTWTTRASMPTARRDLGVVAINGTLYAAGGLTPNGPSATVEAYDPGTDTWTARASLPTPRAGLGVAAINGTLYAVGGFNSATVEAFSPSAVFNAAQTITFNPLGDRTVADPDFSVGATASSGLGVTFSASGSCTVSGSTIHLIGAGSCTVTASQIGDANYDPAPYVAQTFAIARANQVISFAPLGDKTFGDPDFSVGATASSSLGVTFSASGSCTVSGSTVHLIGAGSCTITASQTGDANYDPAPDVAQTFAIARVNQVVSFAPLGDKTFGDPDFSVGATASSGLGVTFSANGSCTVSGSTVHLVGAGSCTVTALQPGDENYNPAVDISRTFAIARANQVTSFAPLGDKTFGDPDFSVSGTASSELAVSFSASGSCTVSGSTVHLIGAGSCTVTASQIGDANYDPAPYVAQTFAIARANQVISFAPLGDRTFGDPDFSVSGTASSELAVSFSASGSCTVNGSTVHLTGAGSCTITGTQAGNENYNPAADISRTFTIAQHVVANAGGPYSGYEGTVLSFDGSGSSGPIGDYTWSFGDGSSGTGASPNHAYADNGTYTVTLTVTDEHGASSSPTTATAIIANVAPTATFTTNSPVTEGSSIQLSLGSPIDPSPVDRAAGFTYAFDCGGGYRPFGATPSAGCPTDDNGTRVVRGKIRDKDGGISEYTAQVTINNVAPTAQFANDGPVNEGSAFHLSLASPADPSSADRSAGFAYAFDCGGGYGQSGTGNSTSCPTTDNGVRAVRGQITDKDGGTSEYTAQVTINNVAPTVTAGANTTITAGDNFTLNGSFTDPGSLDYPWLSSINWGDGSAATTGTSTAPGTVSGTHRYVQATAYTVGLTVRDKDGAPGTGTLQLTVNRLGVAIDMAPFNSALPNAVIYNKKNPQLSTPVAVALLSSPTFDASKVDPARVTLGNGGGGIPVTSRVLGDVNNDGRVDLVLTFSTQQLVASSYLLTTVTTPQTLVLLGEHPDGRQFRGSDQVLVLVK